VWAVGCSSGNGGDDDDDNSCTDECATAGTSCDGDTLVTCAMGTDGCLDETTTDCTATSATCDDSSSPAECVSSSTSCDDVVADGSFESGSTGTDWAETQTQGSPLCDGSCTSSGNSYANTGDWWIWFGGWGADETATLSQDIALPAGQTATLFFFFAVPWPGAATETFGVTYNGTSLFSADATDQPTYPWWQLITVDLSSYADGAAHSLVFTAITGADASFFLDDIYVLIGSPCCVDACAADMTQCSGDAIQTCVATATCNEWSDTTDCSADDMTCGYDENGVVMCTSDCTSDCDKVDDTQCADTVIQTCTANADGCDYWVDTYDCADDTQVCDDSGEDAVCADCVSECDTVSAAECSAAGEIIQTCTTDTDGCNYWVDTYDCADDTEVCDDSGADAVCTACVDECDTVGATQCSATGEVIQTCTVGGDTCNDWIDGTDCAADSQVCNDSGDDAVCTDAVDCTEAAEDGGFELGASTPWTETDTQGSPICDSNCSDVGNTYSHFGDWWIWFGSWDVTETATVSQDVTLPSSETATLFFWLRMGSGATGADSLEVTYDGTEVFAVDGTEASTYETYQLVTVDLSSLADGAAHPLVFTATTSASVAIMMDDVSVGIGDACCVDECETADTTQCDGLVVQTCTVGGDSCNDWVDTDDCGASDEVCNLALEPAVCVAPDELTVDGGWTVSSLAAGDGMKTFYFTGTAGTTYYVWWDDSFEGSDTYTLDLYVYGVHDDGMSIYFGADSAYSTSGSQAVTVGAGESTVYVYAFPYYEGNTGDFAVAVTSADTLP